MESYNIEFVKVKTDAERLVYLRIVRMPSVGRVGQKEQ